MNIALKEGKTWPTKWNYQFGKGLFLITKIILFFIKCIDYEVLPATIGDKVKISQMSILWCLRGEVKTKGFAEMLDFALVSFCCISGHSREPGPQVGAQLWIWTVTTSRGKMPCTQGQWQSLPFSHFHHASSFLVPSWFLTELHA